MSIESVKEKRPFFFIKNTEGLNTYSTRFGRSENQALINNNCVYTKTGFRNRRGQSAVNSTNPSGTPEILYGIEFVRTLGGSTTRKKICFTSDGKVYDYSTDPPTQILSGLTANAIPDVIIARGWLCFVNGTDTPKKWNMSNWYQWGITKPASAPTLAAGAAGSPNGTYRFRVAYRRNAIDALDSGHVSSMGTISATVTVANQAVDLTNIPVSADAQVDARDIYVEIGGQWYLVTTINDNTTTTYTYDALDSETVLNEKGKTDRDPPNSSLSIIELHKDIVFGSDKNTLNWSIIDEFESFSDLNRTSNAYQTGDGTQIIGLRSFNDLIVGKQRSLFIRSGDDVTYTTTKKINDSGVISRNSMVVKDAQLFYQAHDGFRVFDGNESHIISNNINNLLFGGSTEKIVYSNDMYRVSGTYYSNQDISAIIWAMPTSALASSLAICYFIKYLTQDSEGNQVSPWALWDNLDARFLFSAKDPTTSFDLIFEGGADGRLAQVDTGYTDFGDPIESSYLQPDLYFGDPFAKKRLRDAYFSVSRPTENPTGTYQVEWYVNGQSTGVVKNLNFQGTAAIFDTAIFDQDHFAAEGDFVAITGYTSDPFYTIAPRLDWSISQETDEVIWNGWCLRIMDAGYRKDFNTAS